MVGRKLSVATATIQMSSTRDEFLRRIRAAVTEGNRAGGAIDLPDRGAVGRQGAGPDPVSRFVHEWTTVGGRAQVVPNNAAAAAAVVRLVGECGARRILLGRGPIVDKLDLAPQLRAAGTEVMVIEPSAGAPSREALFAADLGISGVDYLVAETGTLVLGSRPDQPRCVSLLPPVHIAVADRSQLLGDLFDLFTPEGIEQGNLPSGLALITGPSKTGDIELRLVTGVHGPGVVHVVLIDPAAEA
jgi:L-lactate dehydrogenase complex protein LldG